MSGAATMAVAAVAGVGLTAYNTVQSHKTASTATGMAQTQFGEQQGFASQLQQLIQNPSSVSQLPGYQFQMGQGTQAVARQMGAAGLGGSDAEAMALMRYGQGQAASFYGQQTQLLAGLSGLQAASSPAQGIAAASGAQTAATQQEASMFGAMGGMMQAGRGAGWFGSAGTPGASYNPYVNYGADVSAQSAASQAVGSYLG